MKYNMASKVPKAEKPIVGADFMGGMEEGMDDGMFAGMGEEMLAPPEEMSVPVSLTGNLQIQQPAAPELATPAAPPGMFGDIGQKIAMGGGPKPILRKAGVR